MLVFTFDERALHAGERGVDVLHVLVLHQVLQQRPRVGQALQHAVHEARVADVAQTVQTCAEHSTCIRSTEDSLHKIK